MVNQVDSIKDIKDEVFLMKFGQDFCIPCEMTENNLKNLEPDYPNVKFYATKNVDEAVARGYKALPVVVISKNGNEVECSDSSILMNQSELKNWIDNNL